MNRIELKEHLSGVCLPVKVQPAARRNEISGVHAGALKVSVSAAPERGNATAAVIELLAHSLQIPRHDIALIKGTTTRQKVFLIRQISLAELESTLDSILTKSP